MMAAGTFKSGDAIKNFSFGLFIFLPQLRYGDGSWFTK